MSLVLREPKKVSLVVFEVYYFLLLDLKAFLKPLTSAEEKYYLQRYQGGDLEARQILIEHNLRLVAHVVKKYQGTDEDLDDLISIGTIGLIKGINTYRADKGVRLATYVSRCIENAILSQRNKRRLRWKTMNLLGQNGLCSAA